MEMPKVPMPKGQITRETGTTALFIRQRKHCDMRLAIGGMDQYANLPVASHTQTASASEVTRVVGRKLDRIGSHIHAEHSSREECS